MADFESRVTEIRSALDGLIDTIGRTDNKLEKLSQEFSTLVRDASKISDMVVVVERLNAAIGRVDIQGIKQLQSEIKQVATSLREVNTNSLTNVAKALERQQTALQQIASLQDRVASSMSESGSSFVSISSSIERVIQDVDLAEEKITQLGRKIKESFRAEDGLGVIAREITEFNNSIAGIDTSKIDQSSTALTGLRDSLLSLNRVTFTGPKLEGVDRTIKQLDKLIALNDKLARVKDIPGVAVTQHGVSGTATPAQSETLSDTEFREKYGVIDTKKKAKVVERQEQKAAEATEQALSADPTPNEIALEIIKQRRRILNELRSEFTSAYKAAFGGDISKEQYKDISKMLATDPTAMSDPKNAGNDAMRLLNNMFKGKTGIQFNNQKLEDALNRVADSLGPRSSVAFGHADRSAILGNTSQILNTSTGDGIIDKFGKRLAQFVDSTGSLPLAQVAIEQFITFMRRMNPGVFIDTGVSLLKFYNSVRSVTEGFGLRILPNVLSQEKLTKLEGAYRTGLPGLLQTGGEFLSSYGQKNNFGSVSQFGDFIKTVAEEYKKSAAVAVQSPINQAIAGNDPRRDEVRADVLSRLSEQELLRTKLIEAALIKLTGNTGLASNISGYAAVNQSTLEKYYKDKGFNPSEVGELAGASIPIDRGRFSQGFTNIDVMRKSGNGSPGEIVLHELVHSITDKLNSQGSGVFQDLETLSNNRAGYLSTKSGFNTVRTRTSAIDAEASKNILGDKDYLSYVLKPEEIYSNIAQNLLSGNEKMLNFFKRLYGNEIFDKAIAALRSAAPETFDPSSIAQIQQGFKEFDDAIRVAIVSDSDHVLAQALSQVSGNPSSSVGAIGPRASRVTGQGASQVNMAPIAPSFSVDSFLNNLKITMPQLNIKAGIEAGLKQKFGEDLGPALQRALSTLDIPKTLQDVQVGNLGSIESRLRTSFNDLLQGVSSQIVRNSYVDDGRPSIDKTIASIPGLDKLVGNAGKSLLGTNAFGIQNKAIEALGKAFSPNKQVDLTPRIAEILRGKTGQNVDTRNIDVQRYFDVNEGFERVSVSARLASGAVVNLNGKIDEFNDLVVDSPKENFIAKFAHQILIELPRQITDQFVSGAIYGLQQLLTNIVNIQDELAEVSVLLERTSKPGTLDTVKARSDFLYSSINTATQTGQPFQEAVQTNVQNFKILAPVKDNKQRLGLANQLSQLQLGAQTAFGITLTESLEALPAIFTQLRDAVPESITDPAERAAIAVDGLRALMDKLVIAQRESGAAGSDLIQVYAQLAESAKTAGLSQDQLLSLTASAAVKLNKSPVETANSIKSIIERTYGEGADDLARLGIAVRQVGKDGVVEFRSFADILRDAVALMDRLPSKAKEVSQAFGSRARASEFVKLASAFPEFERIQGTLRPAEQGGSVQGNEFDQVVERKRTVLTGAFNTLQASLGLFFEQILFGSGAVDDLSKTLTRLATSFETLAKIAKDNPEIIDRIKTALYGVAVAAAAVFTRGLNLFAGIAKVINQVTTGIKGLIAGFTSGATAILVPIQEAAGVLPKIFEVMEQSGQSSLQRLGAGAKSASNDILAIAEAAKVATKGVAGLEGVNAFLTGVTSKPTSTATAGFWNTSAGKGVRNAGEALGSVVLPTALDLTTGGLGGENLTNVGAGIAGGFAGFLVGGPTGSLIGYTIAKSFAQGLDLYGNIFGTSESEKNAFAEQFAKATVEPGSAKTLQASAAAAAQAFPTSEAARFNPEGVSSSALANYRKTVVEGNAPGNVSEFVAKNLTFNQEGFKKQFEFLKKYGLEDLFEKSNVSSLKEFFALIEQTKNSESDIGKLVKDRAAFEEQVAQFKADQNKQNAEGTAYYGSVNITLDEIEKKLQKVKVLNQDVFKTPRGLDQFGAFGLLNQQLDKEYLGKFQNIAKGGLSAEGVKNANATLSDYTQQQQILQGVPSLLGTAVPVAQNLGLDISGLPQTLQEIGTTGQQAFGQQINQLAEMIQYVQEYEANLEAINTITASPEYIDVNAEGRDKLVAKVETLKQEQAAREGMYNQYRQYLNLVQAEPGILQKSLSLLKAQEQAREAIVIAGSKGTPAQFQAASLFNVEDYSSKDLNDAIQYALNKQNKLTSLNPGYKDVFAKDQFLLESNGQFKASTGINQGFVSEYLQQQKAKQQKAPNLEDLSKYSDSEYAGIISRARSLQSQAVALSPDLANKYDNERLLVLRKNNKVLQEVGIGQEFLRAALEDNTKSNEDLRGHYNLPGNYRAPTVWDYYDQGGKETGSMNYVPPGGNGQVSLQFAQQLAKEMLSAQSSGGSGPDLSALANLNQAGARPLFYPNPGTPGTPGTVIKPKPIPSDVFAELMRPAGVQAGLDVFDRHPEVLTPRPKLEPYKQTTFVHGVDDMPNQKAADQAFRNTKESILTVDSASKKTGQSLDQFAAVLPLASSSTRSFMGAADTMGAIMNVLAAKVKSFDLGQTLREASVIIQVVVNGQSVPANQAQVTITNNAKSGGNSSLTAGPAINTQRGISRN